MTDAAGIPHLEIRPEGLFVPAFGAFLDPHGPAARAIVSHAHSDHAAAGHGEVWGTGSTLAIYRRRNPEWSGGARPLAFEEKLEAAGVTLEIFSSGHILGAAQIRVSGPEGSFLYTGDFRRRPSRTAAPAASPVADVLVTECTFGLPVFRFPPRGESERRLVAACRAAADEGAIAVVLAYALGKSQDAALVLTEAGIPTVLHGAAWKLLPEYEQAGFSFPLSRPYDSGPVRPGEALIVPPSCARTSVVRALKKRRIVYLSGWAMRDASRAEHDADVLLPISDHADFDELVEHVDAVHPSRVWTHHGYARDFARILSARGAAAAPLSEGGERAAEDA
ncbi:MAG: DNA ligase-associated DEXH box helicase [Acidobacteriota bacterium]